MLHKALVCAIVVGAFVVATACSSSVSPATDADADASIEGDSSAPLPDAAPLDAAADTKPTGLACYQDDAALVVEGIAPSARAGACTAPQITEGYAKCIAATADCDAWIVANRSCARCMFGVLDDDDPKATPVGALTPISESTLGANEAACAALVSNRPTCAVPLSRQATCTSTVCATCSEATKKACADAAKTAVCAFTVDAACNQAIDANASVWIPVCRGASSQESIVKVATYLCGS